MATATSYDTRSLSSIVMVALIFCSVPLCSSLSTLSISESAGRVVVCGLDLSSRLLCSDLAEQEQTSLIKRDLNLTFSGVVAGRGFVCALRSFGSIKKSVIVCWGFSKYAVHYKRIYKGPEVEELKAADGSPHICGVLKARRQLICWRWYGFRPFTSTQEISGIAVGDDFVCWLSPADVKCTGRTSPLKDSKGKFSVVAAGSSHVCGITPEKELKCWGGMDGALPEGKFVALALGDHRSCALRQSNATVICWGRNNFSLPDSLKNFRFSAIEAKRSTFCGIANHTVYCWGNENFGRPHIVWREKILPGPCQAQCPCGEISKSDTFCQHGFICKLCLSGDDAKISPAPMRWNHERVAFLVIGCVGSVSLMLVITFILFRHFQNRGSRRVRDSGPLEAINTGTSEEEQPRHPRPTPVLEKKLSQLASIGGGGQLEEFPLQDLSEATDGFSQQFKIGSGSFGTVYRATMPSGRIVAFKRAEKPSACFSNACKGLIKRQSEDRGTAFIHELESLSRLNHKNLVRLLGFCEEQSELILVYEYVNNGTLYDHLHKLQTPLHWTARIKIALDAAKGVEYLHEHANPPVIHRDIKSSNILLDATWVAKVSDFGLSLIVPDDNDAPLSLVAAGTLGYIDPEYFRLQQLTTKSDVYSFGVVLLEILTGRKAIHKCEEDSPRNVVDHALPYITSNQIHRALDKTAPPPKPYEIEAVGWVAKLAADCVSLEGRLRPSMAHITDRLKRALALCLAPSSSSLSLSRAHSA